jgi:hypothetical protein
MYVYVYICGCCCNYYYYYIYSLDSIDFTGLLMPELRLDAGDADGFDVGNTYNPSIQYNTTAGGTDGKGSGGGDPKSNLEDILKELADAGKELNAANGGKGKG